jgi:hypothetical protein
VDGKQYFFSQYQDKYYILRHLPSGDYTIEIKLQERILAQIHMMVEEKSKDDHLAPLDHIALSDDSALAPLLQDWQKLRLSLITQENISAQDKKYHDALLENLNDVIASSVIINPEQRQTLEQALHILREPQDNAQNLINLWDNLFLQSHVILEVNPEHHAQKDPFGRYMIPAQDNASNQGVALGMILPDTAMSAEQKEQNLRFLNWQYLINQLQKPDLPQDKKQYYLRLLAL